MTTFQRIIKYCAIAFAIFLIISIIGGIFEAIGMFSGVFGNKSVGNMKTHTISQSIENLDIELSAVELKIISGDRFSVESNHKYLVVKNDDKTLEISESKVPFGTSTKGVTVVLTVPEGFVFEDASIETGAGELDITSLSAKTLNLDLGAGETEIGSLYALTRSKVNTGAGELTIHNGELNDLTMDIGVGEMNLTGILTGNCEVDFGVGEASLTLLGNSDEYEIKLDKGIGDATLNGMKMNDDSTYGSGKNHIDIDGGVGSIKIQFENN